jgi:predicted RND superfamily exporter protein
MVGVGLLGHQASRVLLTYLAVAFVFLFLAVRLHSLVQALLSMVPVLIAVGTVAGGLGVDLQLSPMTAVGGRWWRCAPSSR